MHGGSQGGLFSIYFSRDSSCNVVVKNCDI